MMIKARQIAVKQEK